MKYKISEEFQAKLEQTARSQYAQLLVEILRDREKQLNDLFRSTTIEGFQQIQGRALEVSSLLAALKLNERE